MSTSSVSTAPCVAARATVATSADARPSDARCSKRCAERRGLVLVHGVEHGARLVGELLVGLRLGVAGEPGGDEVRVAAHRPVDGVERLCRGEDERQLEAGEHAAQGVVDLPGELAEPHLLALRALQAPRRRPVADRRLARGARGVRRQPGDDDRERRPVGRHLHEPDRAGRQRQHEPGLGEGDRAQQRLDVEAVGHFDRVLEPVGQPVRPQVLGRGEDGEAVRLLGPELVVVGEVVEGLAYVRHRAALGARRLQLLGRVRGEVLQLDP